MSECKCAVKDAIILTLQGSLAERETEICRLKRERREDIEARASDPVAMASDLGHDFGKRLLSREVSNV